MAKLPNPLQVGDFYLAALLDEIKGLRADLDAARAPACVNNGVVELRGASAAKPEPSVPLSELSQEEIKRLALKEVATMQDIIEPPPKRRRPRARR